MPIPRWLQILKTVGPMIIAMTVPNGALLAPIIITAIAEAEALNLPGADKKKHALAIVAAGAAGVNAASQGKVTVDPAEAVQIATNAIDAVVGAINVIHDAVPDAGLEPAA